MKTPMKHTNSFLLQRAFTYYVKDYDSRRKTYTLVNPITNEEKIMTKADFEKMHEEQHPSQQNASDKDGESAKKILIH